MRVPYGTGLPEIPDPFDLSDLNVRECRDGVHVLPLPPQLDGRGQKISCHCGQRECLVWP